MAWSYDDNHRAMGPGMKMEFGTATLADNTVEVPTKLGHVQIALGTYAEAPGAASQLFSDCVISTLGAVTFADGAVAAKSFWYVLIGW